MADLRVDLAYSDFRLRLDWMEARDTGASQGLNEALDPASTAGQHRGHVDLRWSCDNVAPAWLLEACLSYLYIDNGSNGV